MIPRTCLIALFILTCDVFSCQPLKDEKKQSSTLQCLPEETLYRTKGDSLEEYNICLPSRCLESVEDGPCRSRHIRWFFNPETEDCEMFFYGGCQGNENRFRTKKECEETCLPESL